MIFYIMMFRLTSIFVVMLVAVVAFGQSQPWGYGPYDKLNPKRIVTHPKMTPPRGVGIAIVSPSTNSASSKPVKADGTKLKD
jgi:hypothetical protein